MLLIHVRAHNHPANPECTSMILLSLLSCTVPSENTWSSIGQPAYEDAARVLADDLSWVPEAVRIFRGGAGFVKLDELELDGVATWDVTAEGDDYDLTIELLGGSDSLDPSVDELRIAIDPDLLGPHPAAIPVLDVRRSGEAEEGAVTLAELTDAALPTFIVSRRATPTVEIAPTELGGACRMGPPPPATTYLCLCGVYLDAAKDTSGEEFELFAESWTATTYAIDFPVYAGGNESSSSSYQYKFDGSSHYDATSTSLTFTDVNSKATTYCAAKTSTGTKVGIALAALSSSCTWNFLPIEDDTTSGTFKPSSGSGTGKNYNCSSTSTAINHSPVTVGWKSPLSSGTGATSYLRYSSTATDGDDNYKAVYIGFTSSRTITSVTEYDAGDARLYLATSSNCTTTCSTWVTSSGCL